MFQPATDGKRGVRELIGWNLDPGIIPTEANVCATRITSGPDGLGVAFGGFSMLPAAGNAHGKDGIVGMHFATR